PRLRAGGANEARASSHVMAAACQASDAVPLIELFESEEWTVEALDIQSWAMARACEPLISPTETSTALLSLRWNVATLVLLHKGVVAYHRVLDDAGLKHLHQAMMESANVTSEI